MAAGNWKLHNKQMHIGDSTIDGQRARMVLLTMQDLAHAVGCQRSGTLTAAGAGKWRSRAKLTESATAISAARLYGMTATGAARR
jgi:hypothetical protein